MPSIRNKKWYIVDLRRKNQDKTYYLLRHTYLSKKEAKRVLDLNFKGRLYYFEVVKGSDAKAYGFKMSKKTTDITSQLDYIRRYDYPAELETKQEKKSYRNKFRRWKRTFNKELKNGWV